MEYHIETTNHQAYNKASDLHEWEVVMKEEINFLLKNATWDRVPLPKCRKIVCCKWVYQTNVSIYGSMDNFKSHLVSKYFS
jgi:hypothetical protein